MISFLPTFLVLIFNACWHLNTQASVQSYLQRYYFWFQLFFVILVTIVGKSVSDLWRTVRTSGANDIAGLMAVSSGSSSHFYMLYLVWCWSTHAGDLMRRFPMIKYLFYKRTHNDRDARNLAEPEDQDYWGVGSRSTRID